MGKQRKFVEKAKDPLYAKMLVLAFFAPAVTTLGINYQDISDWGKFLEVMQSIAMNPFLLGTTVFGLIVFFNDTTKKDTEEEEEEGGPKQ